MNLIKTIPTANLQPLVPSSAVQKKQTTLENQTQNQKHKTKLSVSVVYAGTLAASAGAYLGFFAIMKKPFSLYRNFFLKKSRFDKPTTELLKEAAQKSFQKSGLEAKGVKIKFLANSEANKKELNDIFHAGISKIKIKFLRRLKTRRADKMINRYLDGTNASYIQTPNKKKKYIILNEDKIISSFFHELGHAKSFDSKYKKYEIPLQRELEKNAKWLISGAILIPPPSKESSQSKKRSWNNFEIAAPAALLVSKVPRLIEEARASIYGIEFAKEVLPSQLVNKLKKAYIAAFGSYVLPAIVTCAALGTMFAAKNKAADILNKYNDKTS